MVEIKRLRFVLAETGEVQTSPANWTAPQPLTRPSHRNDLVLNLAKKFRKPEDLGGSSRSGLAPALAERTLIAAE
jgi:hypothetical protein